MFCQYCGRELKPGEVCLCRQKSGRPQQSPNRTRPQGQPQPLNRTKPKKQPYQTSSARRERPVRPKREPVKKTPVYLVFCVLCLVLGIAGFVVLRFVPLPFTFPSEIWNYVLPGIFGIAAVILGIAALIHRSRLSVVIPVLLVACAFVICLVPLRNQTLKKNEKLIETVKVGVTEKNVKDIVTDYRLYALKDADASEQVGALLTDELNETKQDYMDGDTTYDEAAKHVDLLKQTGILDETEITAVQSEMSMQNTAQQTYQTGEEQLADGSYEEAIETFKSVDASSSYAYDAAEKIKEAQEGIKTAELNAEKKKEVISAAKKSIKNNDYPAAFSKLKDGLSEIPEDSELQDMLDKYTDTYVSAAVSQADKAVSKKNYSKAIKILQTAAKEVDSDKLKKKLDELDQYKDRPLSSLVVIDSKDYELSDGVLTDSFGVQYSSAMLFMPHDEENAAYAYFNADGKYAKLSGKIAPSEDMVAGDKEKPCRFRLEVYGDEKLIYSSNDFTKVTAAQDFSVAITGVKVLQIRVQCLQEDWYDDNEAILANATLSK